MIKITLNFYNFISLKIIDLELFITIISKMIIFIKQYNYCFESFILLL